MGYLEGQKMECLRAHLHAGN